MSKITRTLRYISTIDKFNFKLFSVSYKLGESLIDLMDRLIIINRKQNDYYYSLCVRKDKAGFILNYTDATGYKQLAYIYVEADGIYNNYVKRIEINKELLEFVDYQTEELLSFVKGTTTKLLNKTSLNGYCYGITINDKTISYGLLNNIYLLPDEVNTSIAEVAITNKSVDRICRHTSLLLEALDISNCNISKKFSPINKDKIIINDSTADTIICEVENNKELLELDELLNNRKDLKIKLDSLVEEMSKYSEYFIETLNGYVLNDTANKSYFREIPYYRTITEYESVYVTPSWHDMEYNGSCGSVVECAKDRKIFDTKKVLIEDEDYLTAKEIFSKYLKIINDINVIEKSIEVLKSNNVYLKASIKDMDLF